MRPIRPSAHRRLTGIAIAAGAAGLVVRLSRDSARHFAGRSGTANISIPVATTSTLRFGIFQGRYQRPRTEFGLAIRYVGQAVTVEIDLAETNVMVYGHAPGESGHGDVRLVIPAAVRALREAITSRELTIPKVGDVALLEWPTPVDPIFRLTFLDQAAQVGQAANYLFGNAAAAKELVGDGACWLPAGIAPPW